MEKKFELYQELKREFHNFLDTHPPAQFSNDLRRLVFDYMNDALQKGIFPLYLNDLLYAINDFLDLLDTAAKQFPSSKIHGG